MSNDTRTEKQKILIEVLRDNLNTIMTMDNALEAKAGMLLGFEVVVLFQVIEKWGNCIPLGYVTGTFLLMVSITFSFCVLFVKNYATGALSSDKVSTYAAFEDGVFFDKLLENHHDAIKHNEKNLDTKTNYFKLALIFFAFGIIVLIITSLRF
jgi:hypothetical protein